jgi:hypothetical protein
MELPQVLQAIVNQLPDAIYGAFAHFAFAPRRTPAGTVQELLGTPGNGAQTPELPDFAAATGLTILFENPVLDGTADKHGVQPGINRDIWIAGHNVLGPHRAGDGDHRVGILYQVIQGLDILRIALPLAGVFDYFQVGSRGFPGNPELRSQDAHLFFAPCVADGDTALTPGHDHLLAIFNHFQNFCHRLGFCHNHVIPPIPFLPGRGTDLNYYSRWSGYLENGKLARGIVLYFTILGRSLTFVKYKNSPVFLPTPLQEAKIFVDKPPCPLLNGGLCEKKYELCLGQEMARRG